MKLTKIIGLSLMAASFGALTSCQNHFDDPELTVPVATLQANTTIAELKTQFMGELALECPVKDETTGEHYIVKGRVISSDATGNIYQTLVIQDETAALPFTIRRASLYDEYHIGQEIVVDLTGLWVGRYNNLFQIGWLGEPYQGSPQLTFMDYDLFASHTQLNGLPNLNVKYVAMDAPRPSDSMYCILTTPDQLAGVTALSPECVELQSQLVQFRNVEIDGAGVETYAPYQETVNRYFHSTSSQTEIIMRNSGYSTFYNDILPVGTGSVTGILSWYGSGSADSRRPNAVQGWQLLIRGLYDVVFDNAGTRETPYTVEEVISFDNNGLDGWAEGYIVGSVKAGVSEVSSDSDIIFMASGELDNNLVIAPSKETRDYSQCVVVELPQGSLAREYANVADNPELCGRKMLVSGSFESLYGMNGIKMATGGAAEFDVEGLVISGVTGLGNGTESDPYLPQFVVAHADEGLTGVWVAGYIVGFVEGTDYATGARFTGTVPANADYNNGNLIIAPSADETDPAKCCVVRVASSFRKALGLKNAPENYRKQLLVRGSIENYLGHPAVNLTEYKLK